MRLPCTYTRTGVAFAEDQRAIGGLGPGGKQESTEAARPPAWYPGQAQVHATLALAATTAFGLRQQGPGRSR
jgi:hypothetical protein